MANGYRDAKGDGQDGSHVSWSTIKNSIHRPTNCMGVHKRSKKDWEGRHGRGLKPGSLRRGSSSTRPGPVRRLRRRWIQQQRRRQL